MIFFHESVSQFVFARHILWTDKHNLRDANRKPLWNECEWQLFIVRNLRSFKSIHLKNYVCMKINKQINK